MATMLPLALVALAANAALLVRSAAAQSPADATAQQSVVLRPGDPDLVDAELFAATRVDSAAGALEGLEVPGSAPRHAQLTFGDRHVEAGFDGQGGAAVRVRHGGREVTGVAVVPLGPQGSRGWRAEVELPDGFAFALIWLRGPARLLCSARTVWVGTVAAGDAALKLGLLPIRGDGAVDDLDHVRLLVDRDGDGAFTSDEVQAAHLPFRVGHAGRRARAVASSRRDAAELVLAPFEGDTAPAIGFRFPDVDLLSLDGTRTKLRQLRGERVVVNVWARHCAPCIQELPALHELASAAAEGVRYVAIAPGSAAELRAFLATHAFGYEQFVAADDSELFAMGYPWHYVLDADGRVVYARFGAAADRAGEISAALDRLRR